MIWLQETNLILLHTVFYYNQEGTLASAHRVQEDQRALFLL